MNENPYQNIAQLYLAIVPPEDTLCHNIADKIASQWIVSNLPDESTILEAGCGLGFDAIALHRGLSCDKKLNVYASDYSQDMLNEAIKYGQKYGIEKERYKRSSFASLKDISEWDNKFDCVMINYAMYTYPEFVTNYEDYFKECIEGVSHVLKNQGYFIFNIRSWNNREEISSYTNIHDDISYHCDYHWYFSDNREHQANMRLSNSLGLEAQTLLHFAQRTPEEYIKLLEDLGYQVLLIDSQDEEFITMVFRRNRFN